MAFWKKDENIQKGKKADKKSAKLVGTKKSVKAKSSKKNKEMVVPEERAELINKILIEPMISEAVMKAQELGKYTFRVRKLATKKQIVVAVESLYKVSVKKVNIINYKPEAKFFRGKKGSTKGYKKAIVTLVEGDKIKLFS